MSQYTTLLWPLTDRPANPEVLSTNQASPVASWAYGVGLRLGVRGISVKGNAALNVQNLAASATLDGTATSFQFDTIGVGFPIMSMLTGLIDQSLTGLDVSTLQEMGNVINDLTAFLADPANAAQLGPQVVGVLFATGTQVQSAAASYGWALRGIHDGLAEPDLNAKQPKSLPSGIGIDPVIVAAVYEDVVGSDSAKPSSAQKDLAKQLASSGP